METEILIFHFRYRESTGNPFQYSCLENPMGKGTWYAAVHGVAKSWARLSNFTLTFHFHALEKEMATHSNVLTWRIPGTGEPGGLPSMGSHRVRHDWRDLAAAAAFQIAFQPSFPTTKSFYGMLNILSKLNLLSVLSMEWLNILLSPSKNKG